ncbi:MAG: hypothetical protein QF886_20600, partial [Planctomycetota bacterium]|nr:hypothetical protein [Planctomycetota bacterium]
AWDAVRRNWPLVKRVYALFEMLQDWACMSVSGSEHGRRWTDTSSYGGYIGFRQMAKQVGDDDAWHEAIYLHAKHAAMRMAMFNGGTYLHQFYGSKPWMVLHSFFEDAGNFVTTYEPNRNGSMLYDPDDLRGEEMVVQRFSFYSLVAEGTGYECPDMFYELMPVLTREFVSLYRKLFPDWNAGKFCEQMNQRHSPSGGITLYEMLLFQLRDPEIGTATIRQQFDAVRANDLIRRHMRGFYRRNNASHEYIEAMLETRDDPAWLEDWQSCTILSAAYDRQQRKASLALDAPADCKVQLGGQDPPKVDLNGKPLEKGNRKAGWVYSGKSLEVFVPHGGTLEIYY